MDKVYNSITSKKDVIETFIVSFEKELKAISINTDGFDFNWLIYRNSLKKDFLFFLKSIICPITFKKALEKYEISDLFPMKLINKKLYCNNFLIKILNLLECISFFTPLRLFFHNIRCILRKNI